MPSRLAVNTHFASTSTEVTAGPMDVKTALEKMSFLHRSP